LTSLPLTLCWSAMVKWGKGTVIEATVVYDAVTTVAYAAVLFGMGERLSPLGALGAALAVTGVVLLHLG
jgi:drug/metabolite transporter (DMT)-like permease